MNSGEESALPMVSSSSSASHKYEGIASFVAGLLLEDDFGSLRVVEVVKELGLITCGRSEFCQGAKVLVWRSGSGYLPRRCPDGRRRRSSGKSTGRSGKRRASGRRDTRRGTESEQTISQPHIMDDHRVMRTCRHSSQCGMIHIMKSV